MKTATQRKSKATAPPAIQAANRPFFKRAGEDNFFGLARLAVVPAIKTNPANAANVTENRPDGRFDRKAPAEEERPRWTNEEDVPGRDRVSETSPPAETQATPNQSAADKTPDFNRPPQPPAGNAGSNPTGATESRKNEEEGIAGPEPKAPESLADQKAANSGDVSALSGRIASAPQSPAQALAVAQAQLINSDCARSEAQVSQVVAARRGQTSAFFSAARLKLASFLISSIIGVQRVIAVRQAEIISAVSRALVFARTAVMGVLQAARALSAQIRVRINQTLKGITTSVQGRVQGIAGQITGLINSVPLPDIPGISRIRAAAVNMLNRAAGVINSAFGRFVGFIGRVLNAGMNMLDILLAGFTCVVGMALSHASSAILAVLHLIARTLNRAVSLIRSSLLNVFTRLILPIINLIEGFINRLISRAERVALSLLRTNRQRSFAALAEAVAPSAAKSGPPAEKGESLIDRIRQIGRDALLFNRLVVQTFALAAGGIITALVGIIASVIARVFTAIAGLIAQTIAKIAAALIQAIQMLSRIIQIIGNFLQELFRTLVQAVTNLVTTLIALVQRGVERIIQFVQDALRRVAGFIGRFVQNLILGRGFSESLSDALEEFTISHGPITRPRPGPITIPAVLLGIVVILASIGALIVYAFPELVVIIAWLVSLGLSPMAAFAVFAVAAILLLLLLLLLLILIIKWITKPKPPKPPDPIITHETTFSAPDGSPNTRNRVGVGEKVEFKGTPPGIWLAIYGTPKIARGPAFTWTAPDRAVTATIRLIAAGGIASVTMDVEEPSSITAIKESENSYPAGTQGAGMVLDFVYHPLRVSFGNAEAREVSGPASNITGYYLTQGMPHYHKAGSGRFFRITRNNKLQPPTRDRANQSGYPSPWTDGRFEWLIPNKFKVITEGGDGKQFTTVTQAFKIEGPSGKTTITKAGEKVERPP